MAIKVDRDLFLVVSSYSEIVRLLHSDCLTLTKTCLEASQVQHPRMQMLHHQRLLIGPQPDDLHFKNTLTSREKMDGGSKKAVTADVRGSLQKCRQLFAHIHSYVDRTVCSQ